MRLIRARGEWWRRHGSGGVNSGFSLIEVCLAILVVGLGLLTVFSLFPSGLRSGEDGTADTRTGLFTESVMGGLRANAMTITNAADWADEGYFRSEVVRGVLTSNNSSQVRLSADILDKSRASTPVAWIFPTVSNAEPLFLRYRLTISPTNKSYSALLEVCDGPYGTFDPAQSVSYTVFSYLGM